jgi:hypothetical protein
LPAIMGGRIKPLRYTLRTNPILRRKLIVLCPLAETERFVCSIAR